MSSPYYLLPQQATNMHDDKNNFSSSYDTLDQRKHDYDSCDFDNDDDEFDYHLLGEELFEDDNTISLLMSDDNLSDDPVPLVVYVEHNLKRNYAARSQRQASLCLRMTSCCGFVIGCAVGSLLEGALLGFLFLVETKHLQVWNMEGFICAAVLFWCSTTALMAMTVCQVLRNLVLIVFATAQNASNNVSVKNGLEHLMGKVIANVDFWYAVGYLFGMLGSWGITCAALEYGGDELVQSLAQEKMDVALLSYNL